jgi:hypothetical protein
MHKLSFVREVPRYFCDPKPVLIKCDFCLISVFLAASFQVMCMDEHPVLNLYIEVIARITHAQGVFWRKYYFIEHLLL